jgi:hypothetical protein
MNSSNSIEPSCDAFFIYKRERERIKEGRKIKREKFKNVIN